MNAPGTQETIDAIIQIADEIARASPESADRAQQIVKLLRGLDHVDPDRNSIQDAIDAQMDDVSDVQLRNTTDAVVRTMREDL